jgi:hypothetical protein
LAWRITPSQRLVVVAGHVDHVRTFARLAQHFLDHVIVRLAPVPAAPELPGVDDVADQVEMLGLVVPQKVQQVFGLAAGGAQVHVGNPDRAILGLEDGRQVGWAHGPWNQSE